MPGRKPRTREQNARYYQTRKAKAIRQQYTGYSQKRKVQIYMHGVRARLLERINTEGFDLDQIFEDTDDPEYWIWFRVNYKV